MRLDGSEAATFSTGAGGNVTVAVARENLAANGTPVTRSVKEGEAYPNASRGEGFTSGELTHPGKGSGKTATVDVDGSAQAKGTGPMGNSVEVLLVCTP